jgi:thioredoxin 1
MKFSEIIKSDTPTLVDFYADWCGPCKMLAPVIQEIKNELGEKVKIVKIDVDKNEKLSHVLNIQSIPTLCIYRNGKLEFREAGAQTKQFLIEKINQIASL